MATTNVDIRVKTLGVSSLSRLDKQLQRTEASTRKLDAALSGLKGAFAGIAGLAGAALGIGAAFDQIKKADEAAAALRSIGANTKELIPALTEVRKELNNNASQAELTNSAFQVLQSGFKKTSDVTDIISASTVAARAKFADVAVVTKGLTSVLNSYGIAASKSNEITNKFFKTIKDGNLTMDEYASVIGKLAPIGSAAGVSLEEINAALSRITQTGNSAGEAATGISAILTAIIAPSKQASDLAAELGIAFNEQALKAKGLAGVLEEVANKTGGSSDKLTTLFGSVEALRAVLALSSDEFVAFNKNLDNQKNGIDAVKKAFDENANTIAGALTRIANSITGLITKGTGLAQVLIPVFDGIAKAIDALDGPIGVVVGALGGLALAWYGVATAAKVAAAAQLAATGSGVVSAIGALATKLAVLGGGATTVVTGFTVAGAAITKTTVAVKAATVAAGILKAALLALPWVAVAAGVTALGVAIYNFSQDQAKLNAILRDGAASTEVLKNKKEELEGRLEQVKNKLDGTTTGFKATGREAQNLKREVAKLQAQLEQIERTYTVRLRLEKEGFSFDENGKTTGYEVMGVKYDSKTGAAVNPPPTVSDIREQQKKLESLLAVPSGGSSSGGKGSGRAPQDDTDSATEMLRQQEQQLDLLGASTDLERQLLEIEHSREDALANIADFQNIAPGLREQLEANEALLASNRANDAIIDDVLSKTYAQTQAAMDALAPLEQQRGLLEAKLNGTEKEYRLQMQIDQIMKGMPAEYRAQVEEIVRGNAALEDRYNKLQEQQEFNRGVINRIGQGIEDGLVQGIEAAITGAEKLEDVLQEIASGVLKDIGKMFIQLGLNAAKQALFPTMGFSTGGIVPPNTTALVGEKGPELIRTGGQTAHVSSNEASRAALSTYSPRNAQTASGSRTIRFESQVINNVEYVTRDEAVAIGRQAADDGAQRGAKMGTAQTMSGLRNSRSQRSKLGLR